MRILSLFITYLLCPMVFAATAYQHAPSDFSDKRESSESIEIIIPTTKGYTARLPSRPIKKPLQENDPAQMPTSLEILSPAEGAYLLHTQNTLEVQVAVTPKLPDKHRIVLYLNGERIEENTTGLFLLKTLPRGLHTLESALISPAGNVLSSSKSQARRFYQQRFFQRSN